VVPRSRLRFAARAGGDGAVLAGGAAQTQPLSSCARCSQPAGDRRTPDQAAGLSCRRGGAVVSDKHANFILNEGGATARDIEGLIHHVQETVRRVHGVALAPEVRIIGEEEHATAV
jgi:UDP-N-acetylmuramate dehydrogenase